MNRIAEQVFFSVFFAIHLPPIEEGEFLLYIMLKRWTESETGIQNITLYSLIDYVIIICCLLKRIAFSGSRAKKLLHQYKAQNISLQASVASDIYNQIIPQNVTAKISALEAYLNT